MPPFARRADSSADDGRSSARPMPLRGVIALDGPSGTGKSTVARQLAKELGARYLDTGAMYRAATLATLQAGIDPADADRVAELVAGLDIQIDTDPQRLAVRLKERDVTAQIRTPEVTAAVSPVSAVPAVRRLLVAQQRRLIQRSRGIVVEGRDIGSVVWPQAELKVYLTASSSERARRRAGELGSPQSGDDISDIEADLQRRDDLDSSRPVGPLSKAPDAIELDTTDLEVSEVVARLIDLLRSRGKAAVRG